MLYIFDLGNVIVDIDFNRVLGAWSDLTRIPLATLKQHFTMGEAFHQHERGELSDEDFAAAMCHEMNMPLSYEQFAHGWQAVFVALRPEVITIMHKLRAQGIGWWCSPIPIVCTPRSGPMNTRKCARPPIAFICRRRWDCVSLKRKFICEYWKKRGFPPRIRSFLMITSII